jgi:hypothetical protein
LAAVAEFCLRNPHAQGGELLEHFKDSEFAEKITEAQASLLENKFEADHMEPEFHGVVANWRHEQSRSRLDTLIAKSERTVAEQVEIRALLAQMNERKSQNEAGSKDATI